MLAARFNKPNFPIIDHFTYTIVSDGDLMEGVSHEACSLAGHLKLGKLIAIYDDNKITIDGSTSLAFSENVQKRFEGYGWDVQLIENGNEDIVAMEKAIKAAQKTNTPSLIILKTTIGYGSPNKKNTADAHGSPLGSDEINLVKKTLDWPYTESFFIPPEVQSHFSSTVEKIKINETKWNELYTKYQKEYPEFAKELESSFSKKLPQDWIGVLPNFSEKDVQATRKASGTVLNAIALRIPNLIQGSADLHPSTNTYLKLSKDFQANQRDARNLHYGVREHAMGSIQNGIALYGAHIPLCSTFLVFADYMRPSIRLSALMGIQSIFVYTHDSIGLGEDGPTHQPIEHLVALRAIPNLHVIRPADGNETSTAWRSALERIHGPTCIILTRQNLPTLKETMDEKHEKALKGAYALSQTNPDKSPDLILIGTGSEVSLCVEAKKTLEKENLNVRVVSMPSWELFDEQSSSYQDLVLPSDIKKLSVEAGISLGWEKYVGKDGFSLSIEHFGTSAPGEKVMQEYGFSAQNVFKKALELLKRK